MATNYPGALDNNTTLPNPIGTDPLSGPPLDHATAHTNQNDALKAIETELGTNPRGAFSTVSARIADAAAVAAAAAANFVNYQLLSAKNALSGYLGIEADGGVNIREVAGPTTPPASRVKIFGKNIANRLMLAMVGPSGLDVTLQPSMKRNKVGLITASGDGTVLTTMGMSAITVVATTTRTTTTASLLQSMRRLGFVTSAAAGSVCSWRQFAAPYYVGVAPNIGGFDASVRFGVSDASLVAGSQMFVGLIQSPGTAPTAVDASTRAFAMIGVGKDAADTNFQIMHKATAVATPATKVDTGIAVATDTAYEICLFATPNIPGQVGWRFENLSTGAFATGTITTDLPAGTLGLGFQSYRSNGATAAAAAMDLSTIYVETDF